MHPAAPRALVLLGVALFAAPLAAEEDRMLRATIEPGRGQWVTSPVRLSISLTGLDAASAAHVAPGSFRIVVDGVDVTEGFFAALAVDGSIVSSPGGLRLSLPVPFAPGTHRVVVSYKTKAGGGPRFAQDFEVYDRQAVLRSFKAGGGAGGMLGAPLVPVGPTYGALKLEIPAVSPSPYPLALVPHDKAFLSKASADMSIAWSSGGAGVQMRSLRILLDGVDVTGTFVKGAESATRKAVALKNGRHTLVAQVVDHKGTLSLESSTFIVFDGTKRHPWFFAPTNQPHPLAHTHHQYQQYSGSPYFHHGVDIRRPSGTKVYTTTAGTISNFYWYGRKPYYFEIEITDDDGFRWQYHHVDRARVPAAIVTLAGKKGRVGVGTEIGSVVYWPVRAYSMLFHHIHLNVLAPDGRYVNPLDLILPIVDKKAPTVQAVYVTQNGSPTVLNANGASGATVGGKLDFVARAQDLVGLEPYQLTLHRMSWELTELTGTASHHVPETTLWTFDYLPGGGNRYANVFDIYRASLRDGFSTLRTYGNYSSRIFYYCLTNRTGDATVSETLGYFDSARRDWRGKPMFPNGTYRLTVRAYDIAGNVGSKAITLNLSN